MRLSISNIAWDVAEDEAVADLLQAYRVDAIDVAPGKYFPAPAQAMAHEMEEVRQWWAQRGIEIAGMQALLFGANGLNIFGDEASRAATHERLASVCRIGAGLGASRLVFGSPASRDRIGLSDGDTMATAVSFFRRLGDVAAGQGVKICLEPVPPRYGANFMMTSRETADVVGKIAHPAIRMQLDTGALTINGEDPAAVLAEHAALIGHVHASEPDLVPLGDGSTDHERMSRALAAHLPEHLVSIEMVATKGEPHVAAIERALRVADRHYRRNEG